MTLLSKICKGAVLITYVLFVFFRLNGMHPIGQWGVSFFALIIAVSSLDTHTAVHGDGKEPGLLGLMSIGVFFASPTFLLVVPVLVADVLERPFPHYDDMEVWAAWVVGSYLAFMCWLPWLMYILIEYVEKRWFGLPKKKAEQ